MRYGSENQELYLKPLLPEGAVTALVQQLQLQVKCGDPTLKAFSLAKFKIRSRLSRVVLVASNTWQKRSGNEQVYLHF